MGFALESKFVCDIRFLQLAILGLQWDVRHTYQQPPCKSELMLILQQGPEQAVHSTSVCRSGDVWIWKEGGHVCTCGREEVRCM